jgi:hypothetical protein
MEAERETWFLVVGGSAVAGSFDVAAGDVLFAQSDQIGIHSGAIGIAGLVAYTGGGAVPRLLQHLKQPIAINVTRPQEIRVPPSLGQPRAVLKSGRVETIK